jgi:hypothetical protein
MQIQRFRLISVLCLVAVVAVAAGCKRRSSSEPPVATPGFNASHPRAPLGSPIDLTYSFAVAPNATINGDYIVFVHFLDSENELMWTDDHVPAPPTNQWKPGQKIQYTHTMFIPVYPYIGDARVRMGLYAKDGKRLPLAGKEVGDREYEVGTITLAPQSENVFLIYRDGWHSPESSPEAPALEWQWTKKTAGLSFRNPKKDVIFYLDAVGAPDVLKPAQQVTVKVNDQVVTTVPFAEHETTIHRIPITAAQLGTADTVDLKLDVDRTFVPAQIPAGQPGHGADTRELGIRVYHVYVGLK